MLKFVEISSSFLIILRIVSIFLGRGLDGGKGVNKLKKIKSVNICDAIFLLRRLDSRGFSKICTLLPFWFIGVVRQGFEGLVDLFVFVVEVFVCIFFDPLVNLFQKFERFGGEILSLYSL